MSDTISSSEQLIRAIKGVSAPASNELLRVATAKDVPYKGSPAHRLYLQYNVDRVLRKLSGEASDPDYYKKLTNDYFTYEAAKRHKARRGQVLDRVRGLMKHSRQQNAFRFVEVAAGSGQFGEELREEISKERRANPNLPEFIYVPIDLAAEPLDTMKNKNFSPVKANAEHLPFPSGSTQVVYAGEIIEHLPYETCVKFLQEAHRILDKSGEVILTTPNYLSNPAQEDLKEGKMPLVFDPSRDPWAHEHVFPFTKETLMDFLERIGFEVTSVSTNQITWKIENGAPVSFTIYGKAQDVPVPEKRLDIPFSRGDSLIVSARKKASTE